MTHDSSGRNGPSLRKLRFASRRAASTMLTWTSPISAWICSAHDTPEWRRLGPCLRIEICSAAAAAVMRMRKESRHCNSRLGGVLAKQHQDRSTWFITASRDCRAASSSRAPCGTLQ